MTYALLLEENPGSRDSLDEILNERYLSEFPEGFERNRETARRMARSMGVNQGGALQAMHMPQHQPGGVPRIAPGGPIG